VGHGHVVLNGHKATIASMNLKPGDKVSIKERVKSKSLAQRGVELTQIVVVPDWLIVDKETLTGTVARIPTRDEINPIVNEQLVVELYSR